MGLFGEDKPLIEMYHAQRKPSELTHLHSSWRARRIQWLLLLASLFPFVMGLRLLLSDKQSTEAGIVGVCLFVCAGLYLLLGFLVSSKPVLCTRIGLGIGLVLLCLSFFLPVLQSPYVGILVVLLALAMRVAPKLERGAAGQVSENV